MKKSIMVFVLVLSVFFMSYSVHAEGDLHTLWGIPFGSTSEELIKLVKEKGLELYADELLPDTVFSKSEKTITFLGHEVREVKALTPDDKLTEIRIQLSSALLKAEKMEDNYFLDMSTEEDVLLLIKRFVLLANEFSEVYGYPNVAMMSIGSNDIASEEKFFSVNDDESITHAFFNHEKVILVVCYANITLTMTLHEYNEIYASYFPEQTGKLQVTTTISYRDTILFEGADDQSDPLPDYDYSSSRFLDLVF